ELMAVCGRVGAVIPSAARNDRANPSANRHKDVPLIPILARDRMAAPPILRDRSEAWLAAPESVAPVSLAPPSRPAVSEWITLRYNRQTPRPVICPRGRIRLERGQAVA